jgi:NAD(P)-dependent dehydrogenase (short-subunit alcohol dehydrogenase family)
MALVEGEAVVTGGARGVGRAHALAFADAGARVVANDLGCEVEGTGSSVGPAGEVVDEIGAMGRRSRGRFAVVSGLRARHIDPQGRRPGPSP